MDPETAQNLIAGFGAAGGGAAVLALVNALIKYFSGASGRERIRNNDLVSQRNVAIEESRAYKLERDEADDKRREAEEHVAMLKWQLMGLGITPVERHPPPSTTQE